MTVLELRDITHRYGEKEVLRHVSLCLAPGQRIALMGQSGAGKTTLLRIALGTLKPTGGQVRNGFSKTAAVFQEPRLLPWRMAAENVNLVLGDSQKTMEQAKHWLSLVELGEAAEKYPAELSGGMQQRVALARALAVQGDLLVLDEPFKAMDEALRQRMLALVGKTTAAVLLVTHSEEEAAALGCEILRLWE